jgi:hypothetical protein
MVGFELPQHSKNRQKTGKKQATKRLRISPSNGPCDFLQRLTWQKAMDRRWNGQMNYKLPGSYRGLGVGPRENAPDSLMVQAQIEPDGCFLN